MNMNKKFLVFGALCSVIFLDGVGLGLIFPLLVPIFWDPHVSILSQAVDVTWRNIWYGVTLSMFPLGLFFAAPMLGDLSDGYGRKKILIIAVLGVGTSYLLSALAVMWHSLPLLIFSRLFAGLFSGCQPIAQAAVMDMSTENEKAKNLSLIFFFASAGFVIGPLLGGCLSNPHWVSWFSISTPLFAATIFSFTCSYLLKNFQETLTTTRAVAFRPLRGLYVLKEAWHNQAVRMILLVLFCYQISWGGFFQVVPAFIGKQYHLTSDGIGYFSSLIGVGFGIAFLGCIDYLTQRFPPKKIVFVTFVIAIICMMLTFLWQQMLVMWLIAIPIGFAVAHIYVLLSTIGSNSVAPTFQGWFMGAAMSIMALAWFISPLINSFLLNWHLFAPLIFSAAVMIIAWLIFVKQVYPTIKNS